jgi:hypothetical protein
VVWAGTVDFLLTCTRYLQNRQIDIRLHSSIIFTKSQYYYAKPELQTNKIDVRVQIFFENASTSRSIQITGGSWGVWL